MSIKYYKLFDIMNRRGISKTELRTLASLTPATASKLFKGESVNVETIDKICAALELQPGDFMEYVPDKEPPEPPKPKERKDTQETKASSESPSEATESPKVKLNAGSVELLKGQILLSVPMPDGTTETVIAWEDDSVELAKKEAAVRNAKPGSLERNLAEVTLNRFKYSMKIRNDEYLEGLTG